MEIIQINENNISEYYQLLDLFSNEFDDKLNYQNNLPTKEYAKKILTNKSTIILICKADNQIVGGLVAYLLAKFEQERSELYIYDLAVDSNWRRRRIATSLIYELKKYREKSWEHM
jgi:aminoglycoside 3-N-acetyltransferase I